MERVLASHEVVFEHGPVGSGREVRGKRGAGTHVPRVVRAGSADQVGGAVRGQDRESNFLIPGWPRAGAVQNQTCHGEGVTRRYRGPVYPQERATPRHDAQPTLSLCRTDAVASSDLQHDVHGFDCGWGPEHAVEVAGSIREARGHRYGAMRPPPGQRQ